MPHDSGPIIWTERSPSHSPRGVLAELQAGEWRFFEQEEGEVRWYRRPTSPTLIAKAEAEHARRLRTGEAALREAV
jgi:hypothetical protein